MFDGEYEYEYEYDSVTSREWIRSYSSNSNNNNNINNNTKKSKSSRYRTRRTGIGRIKHTTINQKNKATIKVSSRTTMIVPVCIEEYEHELGHTHTHTRRVGTGLISILLCCW